MRGANTSYSLKWVSVVAKQLVGRELAIEERRENLNVQ